MVTVKVIYRTDKTNLKNEHPLYLRITKHRRSKYIALKIYLLPEHWDEKNIRVKKSHPNSQRLNNHISKKYSEAEAIALDMSMDNKNMLPEKVKEQIMGATPKSFLSYADKYIEEVKCLQKMGTYRRAKTVVTKLREYCKNRDLMFEQITISWLKEYEQYLRSTLENRINTIHSNFRIIRRIINSAIDENIINTKSPFDRFKLTLEKTTKEYLTEEELKLIEDAELERGSKKELHRNMYVFSAYAGGLRISDILLLKWKHFNGENIRMNTKKTSSAVSIKLPNKALEILELYRTESQSPEDFIFPKLDSQADYKDSTTLHNAISSATAYTNDDLKEIATAIGLKKHLSFHTARHTFATRALQKGMRIEYVSKLMGHSSIATTQIYAKIVNEELDRAMEIFNQ